MKLADWITFLCLIIALIIMWQFRGILLLIFTAIVVAIALNSIVRRIQKLGISRGTAVLLAISLVLLLGTLFFSLVVPPFLAEFQQLIQLVPDGFQEFLDWSENLLRNPPAWFPRQDIQLPDVSDLTQQIGILTENLLKNFFAFFSNSVALLLNILLLIVLSLMFLSNPGAYRRLALRLSPSLYRGRIDTILSECEIALLNWMGGIALNSLFVASLSGIGLSILGIRFVLANALIAGVFNFIPNIGPTMSAVFPLSVALLDQPLKAVAIIILYVVIQNLESYWFSPMVMQQQLNLLPALTLIAQIFFAYFFGFLGLVLALPLAVVLKTLIEEVLIKDILERSQNQETEELSEDQEMQLAPAEEIIATELPESQE